MDEEPSAETSRNRILTMDELSKIWTVAWLLGSPLGQYVRILALTAQRPSEVASMRWDELDLDAGSWIIPAKPTSTHRTHMVPLSKLAVKILTHIPRTGPFVFAHDETTHVADFEAEAELHNLISTSDANLAPWELNELRRTAATQMVRLGVSEGVVERVLNCAPDESTAVLFALRSAREKRDALDRWAAALMRAVQGDA